MRRLHERLAGVRDLQTWRWDTADAPPGERAGPGRRVTSEPRNPRAPQCPRLPQALASGQTLCAAPRRRRRRGHSREGSAMTDSSPA